MLSLFRRSSLFFLQQLVDDKHYKEHLDRHEGDILKEI
jgi:hypothetical protein